MHSLQHVFRHHSFALAGIFLIACLTPKSASTASAPAKTSRKKKRDIVSTKYQTMAVTMSE
jgi:hypothetical protein